MFVKKVMIRIICGLGLLMTTVSQAAIVNNNHLYQQSEIIINQLKLIRQKKSLPQLDPQPPIVSGKLATTLMFKVRELNSLASELQTREGVSPTAQPNLPFRIFRPFNVMQPLKTLAAQLKSVQSKLGIATAASDVSVPLGKSSNDVYRQLMIIETLFGGLSKDDRSLGIETNINAVRGSLMALAQAKQRTLTFPELKTIKGREATDVNLLAYQIIYLTGRFFREIGVDATDPGRFPTGNSTLAQVEDSLLNLRSELHRGRTIIGATTEPTVAKMGAANGNSNTFYAQLTQVRDGLLAMLDGGKNAR